jgi:membrane protease YdiL (CAAX protease family)
MTGIFLTERLTGWITVTAPPVTESGLSPGPAALLSLTFYFTVAAIEEFTFRGYQLQNLSEGLAGQRLGAQAAIVAALLLSSAIFGLLHATNSNATATSTLNITLAGVLLGLPYILTGELAISIGLHLSWNFFQGTVFGFPVSGSVPSRRLLIPEQSGPTLWTGGAFGPEGGLLGTVATVIGCVLVIAWGKFRYGRVAIDSALARYEARS